MESILCNVSVNSELKQGDQRERIEAVSDGFFRKRKDGAELFYKENQPATEDEVKVHITFSHNKETDLYECRIIKEGTVKSEMLFIRDFETPCAYVTPFGELSFDIYTSEITVSTEEDGMQAFLSYSLLDRGEIISEASVSITAKRKTCPDT